MPSFINPGKHSSFDALFEPLIGDPRSGFAHICLYLALVLEQGARGGESGFLLCRPELMRMAKIRSEKTYYRLMRDLADWGYVNYKPSFDPGKPSLVGLKGIY